MPEDLGKEINIENQRVTFSVEDPMQVATSNWLDLRGFSQYLDCFVGISGDDSEVEISPESDDLTDYYQQEFIASGIYKGFLWIVLQEGDRFRAASSNPMEGGIDFCFMDELSTSLEQCVRAIKQEIEKSIAMEKVIIAMRSLQQKYGQDAIAEICEALF